MSGAATKSGLWSRLPIWPRAVISGLVIGLGAANVWSVLLLTAPPSLAAIAEVVFLAAYLWWAHGGGPPASTRPARQRAFRSAGLPRSAWPLALLAALVFAASVHSAMVILFRLVPFPAAAFRQGYDLSPIPTMTLKWLVVLISATSAGVCEETGFRGYMQQPLEARFGPRAAILTSAAFFTLVHLNKGWSTVGMVPIVLGAGLLLGALAWASRSIVPGVIGHILMDIGLFAYWWTGIAGTFSARPISETGVDAPFVVALAIFAASLAACLTCVGLLRRVTA